MLESHGRRGIGRALMDVAVGQARESGASAVVLVTQFGVPWNEPWDERIWMIKPLDG